MSWRNNSIIIDGKIIYKGVDIGLTRENIEDIQSNTGIEVDEYLIESIYNQHISVIRNKKINEVLS